MMIEFNPDDWETVSEHRTCEYHRRHPGDRSYPGCTCSGSYGLRRKGTLVPEPLDRASVERAMKIAAAYATDA